MSVSDPNDQLLSQIPGTASNLLAAGGAAWAPYAAPLLRMLLPSAPFCLFVVDSTGNLIVQEGGGLKALSQAEQRKPGGAGPGVVTGVGRTLERLLGRSLDETLQAHPLFLGILQRALKGESTSGVRGEQHGLSYDIWAMPTPIAAPGQASGAAADEPPGAMLVALDVTARVAAERAARYQETLFQQLTQGAPVVIGIYDLEGRIERHVGAGLAKLGLEQNQLKGTSVYEAFAGADEALKNIRAALAGEHNRNTQSLGETIWDNYFSPLYSDDSSERTISGALSISTDVTERERAQAAMRERLQIIEEQNRAIRAMSAPIIEVWQGVLVVPIVGQLDTDRASVMMESLLHAIGERSAEYAILDFTAVEVIDTATADHVLRMVSALKLLGAQGLVSGIRPPVAQALVSLGVDLTNVITVSSLHAALRLCMRQSIEGNAAVRLGRGLAVSQGQDPARQKATSGGRGDGSGRGK